MYKKLQEFINKNIGRKLTFILVPSFCIILILTITIIGNLYSKDLINSIEERTQYTVETSKINMDHYVSNIKQPMNMLSMNKSIRNIMSMDMKHIDYVEYVMCERELKSEVNAYLFTNINVQNLIIVGKNGYQYDYLNSVDNSIMECSWFKEYVDPDELGFQYILPHDLSHYSKFKAPSKQKAVSILLPIKTSGKIQGYVIAEINISNLMEVPDIENKENTMHTYLVSEKQPYLYDFSDDSIKEKSNEPFLSLLDEEKSKFTTLGDEFVAYSKMTSNNWYIVSVYPYKEIIHAVKRIQKLGVLMTLIGCAMVVIVGQLLARFIRKPINDIVERINTVEKQNFETIIPDYSNQPGEIVLIRKRFEEMICQIDELVNKVYLDEIYQKKMEYDQLVNQINPHFLYNILQLIQSKAVLADNYEINDIVVSLSKLLRYNMSNQNKFVTVKEECEYVRNYLDLYMQRYSGMFTYEIVMEPEIESKSILKFLIQPIVENSIKHGFKGIKENGYIKINVSKDVTGLKITVWDNGNGISEERQSFLYDYLRSNPSDSDESIGLKNTYERLNITYGDAADIRISSVEKKFTEIICIVPMEEI